MALNFSLSGDDGRNVVGNRRVVSGTYTGPTSYATGGDSIAATDVGLSDIRSLDLGVAADASAANPRLLRLNAAGTKIMWFVPNTGNEVANATNLSAFTASLQAEGR
jgi:hypothetical protein